MAFCRCTHFMRRGSPTIAPSMRQWFCRDDASVTSELYFERLNSNCAGRAPEGKGSQSPTHAPRWRSTRQSDAMNQRFSFTSNCPRCQRDRVIETYTRGALLRLLDLGPHRGKLRRMRGALDRRSRSTGPDRPGRGGERRAEPPLKERPGDRQRPSTDVGSGT